MADHCSVAYNFAEQVPSALAQVSVSRAKPAAPFGVRREPA
jgi:hypothetical protein